MPKFTVITQASVRRTYTVDATDEKSAVAESTFRTADDEEDISEEVLVVEPCSAAGESDGR